MNPYDILEITQMKTKNKPFFLVLVALLITSFNVCAVESPPDVPQLLLTQPFKSLDASLSANTATIRTLLDAVKDQISYTKLANFSRALAAKRLKSRVTITLPDGTVVYDSSKQDDPGDTLPIGNSYQHFLKKTINENLNTRVSTFDAQEHVLGKGAETRFSTTDLTKESFVAIRLGAHLNNSGTARLSLKQ